MMPYNPLNTPPNHQPGNGIPPARSHPETTFGYVCMECSFVANHGYAGYAMSAVQDHCMATGHQVKAGLDV